MRIAVIDIESFYDAAFSLTHLTTEEYIRSPLFEIIGVSVSIDGAEPQWYSGTKNDIHLWLLSKDLRTCAVCAHNAAFDLAILNWHFDIRPKIIMDTMSMSAPVYGINESLSLANLAKLFGLEEKGHEIIMAKGKRRADFTPAELAAYGAYCCKDVRICWELLQLLSSRTTQDEMRIIDMTIRMFTEPVIELDHDLLVSHLKTVKETKAASMKRLADALGVADDAELKKLIMSNAKFADILRTFGVDPPMKISPTTGKSTYAFAKTDEAFTALADNDSETIQWAMAARLGNKSTIEESRTEAFISVAGRGTFPFPLKYAGAAVTHRASGFDVNPQNLPRNSPLRRSWLAPPGFKLLSADLSQIELRLGLWFATQDDKIDLLRDGFDLYRDFASEAFDIPYDSIGKESDERFVGKTCIAEGGLVLTPAGLKPIERISLDDKVWDGVEWVSHTGVIFKGVKDVITYQGLTATADHEVWTQDGRHIPFGEAQFRLDTLATTGLGGTPVWFVDDSKHQNKTQWEAPVAGGCVRVWNGALGGSGKPIERENDSMPSLRHHRETSEGGEVCSCGGSCAGSTTEAGCGYISTLSQPNGSRVGKLRRAWDYLRLSFCDGVVHLSALFGASGGFFWDGDRSYQQQSGLPARQYSSSHEKNQQQQPTDHAIYQSCRGANPRVRCLSCDESGFPRCEIRSSNFLSSSQDNVVGADCGAVSHAAFRQTKRVYDITNAGPRHRFTVSGKLVSNCSLALIYGTGAVKLQETIRILSKGKVKITGKQAEDMKNLYRSTYRRVQKTWWQGNDVLEALLYGQASRIGREGVVTVTLGGILKPNGMLLPYPDLRRQVDATTGREGFTYAGRRGKRERVYGSMVFQRIIQSLARDIIMANALALRKYYRAVGMVHDELILLVPEGQEEEAENQVLRAMRTPPVWAPGLPLDAEVKIDSRYMK